MVFGRRNLLSRETRRVERRLGIRAWNWSKCRYWPNNRILLPIDDISELLVACLVFDILLLTSLDDLVEVVFTVTAVVHSISILNALLEFLAKESLSLSTRDMEVVFTVSLIALHTCSSCCLGFSSSIDAHTTRLMETITRNMLDSNRFHSSCVTKIYFRDIKGTDDVSPS